MSCLVIGIWSVKASLSKYLDFKQSFGEGAMRTTLDAVLVDTLGRASDVHQVERRSWLQPAEKESTLRLKEV